MEIITISEGVAHSRSTYSKQLVYGPADWAARIGSSGGEHNISTCEACSLRSIMNRWRKATGVADEWKAEEETVWDAVSHGPNGTLNQRRIIGLGDFGDLDVLGEDEFHTLVARQADRFMRIARTCSDRRLQSLQREVRKHAAEALAQAKNPSLPPIQAKACMYRYFACLRAADVMFERMRRVAG